MRSFLFRCGCCSLSFSLEHASHTPKTVRQHVNATQRNEKHAPLKMRKKIFCYFYWVDVYFNNGKNAWSLAASGERDSGEREWRHNADTIRANKMAIFFFGRNERKKTLDWRHLLLALFAAHTIDVVDIHLWAGNDDDIEYWLYLNRFCVSRRKFMIHNHFSH